jgi:hypothetical protein
MSTSVPYKSGEHACTYTTMKYSYLYGIQEGKNVLFMRAKGFCSLDVLHVGLGIRKIIHF